MDVDDILSQFGEKSKSKDNTSFDVDRILSEFGGKPETVTRSEKPSIITVTPKPPISGISKEASDELNQTRVEKQGGENPRRMLPTTSIQDTMAEHGIAAKELLGEAANDFETSHPYKGIGKSALGLLSAAASPFTGAIEGSVNKVADQLFPKGNQDIPRYPDPIYGTPTGMPLENIASTGDRAGFVASSLIPVGKTGKAVNAARPTNKAFSTLIESIGPENLPSVVSAMKANPRLAPADLSPRVLQDTQHLFANEGPQIDYLAKTSGNRMATAKEAVRAIHGTDVPVDTVAKLKSLADAAKKAGNDIINPALAAAKPVNLSSTLETIDTTLKPGVLKIGDSIPLTEVKKELENIRKSLRTSKEYDAKDLHSFQSGLRKTAERLLKSATGGDREVGQALMNVRNSLVSDIDKATPKIKIMENGVEKEVGSYKHGLNQYREEKHVADAFRDGYEGVFSNSKKMENRPEHTEAWFKNLNEHEQEAAREGTRAAIDTEIGIARNGALAGESFTRSDFNRAKLETILGKKEAQERITKLEHERAIANTHNKIVEGSQTAMRTASKSQFALPDKTEVMKSAPMLMAAEGANFFYGGYPGMATAAAVTAKTGATIKDKINLALAREHNAQYAKLALPTEGPSRDALIQSLEAAIPGPKQSVVRRGANALSRLVAP